MSINELTELVLKDGLKRIVNNYRGTTTGKSRNAKDAEIAESGREKGLYK